MSKTQLLRLDTGLRSEEKVRIMLTDEELEEKRQEFVTLSGQLADKEEAKKEKVKELTEEIKPIKAEVKELLDITRKGYYEEHREVRLHANDHDRTIEIYDLATGELLSTRPQKADERAPILFSQSKTPIENE